MAAILADGRTATREREKPRSLRLAAALRLLRSRELALGLLVLIMAAAVSGTLLPQRALTPPAEFEAWQRAHPLGSAAAEALSLTQVYQSWWFLSLLATLCLSLLVCTVFRAQQVWKLDQVRHREGRAVPLWVRMAANHVMVPVSSELGDAPPQAEAWGMGEAPAALKGGPGNRTPGGPAFRPAAEDHQPAVAPSPDQHVQQAAAALAAAGYRVRRQAGTGQLFAEKGRLGVWGSTVLHLSIVVMLLGGVYSGAAKMAGYFELAEGQVFTDRHDGYLQLDEGPLSGDHHRGFQVRLDRLHAEHWDNGETRSLTSTLTLRSAEGRSRQTTVAIDGPLSYQGATIYQAGRYGFAVLLALKDPAGEVVASGSINFPTPKERTQPSTNRFAIPRTAFRAEADFSPAPGGGPVPEDAWRQERPSQAWLYLFVRDDQGKLIFQGPLAQGETVSLGAYALSFDGVARWAGFPVVRDPGLPVIFAGFALCVFGAALTFLWTPRRLWVWEETTVGGQGRLCLGGRADKFPLAFAEEIRELGAQIGASRT